MSIDNSIVHEVYHSSLRVTRISPNRAKGFQRLWSQRCLQRFEMPRPSLRRSQRSMRLSTTASWCLTSSSLAAYTYSHGCLTSLEVPSEHSQDLISAPSMASLTSLKATFHPRQLTSLAKLQLLAFATSLLKHLEQLLVNFVGLLHQLGRHLRLLATASNDFKIISGSPL